MSTPRKRAYGQNIPLIDVFPFPIYRPNAPASTDKDFDVGQVWIHNVSPSSKVAYMFGGLDGSQDAIWLVASPGASEVDTINSLSPVAGDILIDGGTNITDSNAGHTVTLNLDAAITLATSVTSPLYTVAAATDLAITSAAGQDIVMKMGDAAGANKVSFVDSADAEVFAIDSNGGIGTLTGLTVTGAFTASGGTASLNASSNFNTVINSGTSTGTVTVGNSLAGAITVDTGAGISLDAVTASNLTVTGAADLAVASTLGGVNISSGEASTATGITLDATAADGGVTINAGTGGILIGNTADCTTIDVGDFAPTASRTITVGGGQVATAGVADTIDIGVDAVTTEATASKVINIGTGTNDTGTLTLNVVSGTITSGTVAANLLTGTGTKTLNIGNADALTTMNLDGPFLVSDSVNANTSINTGTSTGTVSIGNSAAGAITVDTAAGISLDAATASNFTVTGVADLSLISTAGSLVLNAEEAAADAIQLTSAAGGLAATLGLSLVADAAGNIEINSSAGTILIGNDDVDQNASFATDGVRVVTLGSTNGAASLVLQAGTGGITMTGTVDQVDAKIVKATGFDLTIKSSPTTCTAANTGGVATGATGDTNLLSFKEGIVMEQFILGAGQTIIKPVMDNSGLLCSLDLTDTQGAEYNFGAARTLSEFAFTVGTSAAFFFEVTMTVADISGGNPYMIGFRKAEANNATFADYTDYYGLGMFGGTSATNLTLVSELNSGGQTLQDSTTAWTGGDGGTVTMKVLVSAAGVVTATIDAGAPGAPLAYTFDAADVVCPFIRLTHGAVAPGAVHLVDMSCGFQ